MSENRVQAEGYALAGFLLVQLLMRRLTEEGVLKPGERESIVEKVLVILEQLPPDESSTVHEARRALEGWQ